MAMRLMPVIALLLLAACSGEDERRAGGVSEDEAQALDDAAEMIEARRLPDAALAQPTAAATAETAR